MGDCQSKLRDLANKSAAAKNEDLRKGLTALSWFPGRPTDDVGACDLRVEVSICESGRETPRGRTISEIWRESGIRSLVVRLRLRSPWIGLRRSWCQVLPRHHLRGHRLVCRAVLLWIVVGRGLMRVLGVHDDLVLVEAEIRARRKVGLLLRRRQWCSVILSHLRLLLHVYLLGRNAIYDCVSGILWNLHLADNTRGRSRCVESLLARRDLGWSVVGLRKSIREGVHVVRPHSVGHLWLARHVQLRRESVLGGSVLMVMDNRRVARVHYRSSRRLRIGFLASRGIGSLVCACSRILRWVFA